MHMHVQNVFFKSIKAQVPHIHISKKKNVFKNIIVL